MLTKPGLEVTGMKENRSKSMHCFVVRKQCGLSSRHLSIVSIATKRVVIFAGIGTCLQLVRNPTSVKLNKAKCNNTRYACSYLCADL